MTNIMAYIKLIDYILVALSADKFSKSCYNIHDLNITIIRT